MNSEEQIEEANQDGNVQDGAVHDGNVPQPPESAHEADSQEPI